MFTTFIDQTMRHEITNFLVYLTQKCQKTDMIHCNPIGLSWKCTLYSLIDFKIQGHVKRSIFMRNYHSISGCIRVFEKISVLSSILSGTRDNHNNTTEKTGTSVVVLQIRSRALFYMTFFVSVYITMS